MSASPQSKPTTGNYHPAPVGVAGLLTSLVFLWISCSQNRSDQRIAQAPRTPSSTPAMVAARAWLNKVLIETILHLRSAKGDPMLMAL
jgi:hypothetical protein